MNSTTVALVTDIAGVLSLATLVAAVLVASRDWALSRKHLVIGIFLVSLGSLLGSLFYSEIAHWVPCTLCWWQRILTYPITLMALVSLFIPQSNHVWWFTGISSVGALGVSVFQILIQEVPSLAPLSAGLCTVGASCTTVHGRAFGLMSMPMMAVAAELFFLACIVAVVRFCPPLEADSTLA